METIYILKILVMISFLIFFCGAIGIISNEDNKKAFAAFFGGAVGVAILCFIIAFVQIGQHYGVW